MPSEHRRPLVAFVLVALLSGIVIINGLRTQAVAHLVAQGGSHRLVAALAPEMVLGSVLREAGVPTGSMPSALLVNPGAARAAANERAVAAQRAATTTTQVGGSVSAAGTASGAREHRATPPKRVAPTKPAKQASQQTAGQKADRQAAKQVKKAQQLAAKQARQQAAATRKAQKQAQKQAQKPAPVPQAHVAQQGKAAQRAEAERRLRALIAQAHKMAQQRAQERAHKWAQKRAQFHKQPRQTRQPRHWSHPPRGHLTKQHQQHIKKFSGRGRH